MQFGRTIIGAIIGAALGIGVLVAVYLVLGYDKVWMSIPVAILTGLGVRTVVSTGGHASYLRGAITGVLALGAYLLGWWVVAQVATARANANSEARPGQQAAATQPAEASDDAKVEAPPEAAKAPEQPRARQAAGAANRKAPPPGQSPLDYIWLGVAALIAYELGRGTAAKPVVVVGEETVTEVPQQRHPDA